jgi:type I restriction enzyme S subunit
MAAYNKYNSVEYDYVNQLPDGWNLLPNIAIFQERIERGYENEELLSVTIGRGVIKQSDLDKKDSSTLDKSKYLLVYCGDLVYSMRFRQGASGCSNYIGIVSPACTVLKPKKGVKLNSRYYHYMFRTVFYKNYAERYAYGIADGQMPLRYTDFKRMYSIVPPFEIQNSIVEYLDKKTNAIDRFIRNKERLIELLEERKKKVISKNISNWIHTELKTSGVSWIGNIPKHWNVSNLKYLLKRKLKYGANEEAKDANLEHPRYIRITDFGFDGKLSNDTFRSLPFKKSKEYLLTEGDILFARSGATVGKTFQFKEYNGLACFAGYLIKASPNDKKILSDFLYLYTQSSLFEEWKNGIFDKATIENIGADKYAVLKVIVPPIDEQILIIEFVKIEIFEINLAISKAQQEITSIKEYREALITDLVTGKRSFPISL